MKHLRLWSVAWLMLRILALMGDSRVLPTFQSCLKAEKVAVWMRDDFCGSSQFDTLIPRKYLIHDDIQSSQCQKRSNATTFLYIMVQECLWGVWGSRIITLQLCVHSSSLSDRWGPEVTQPGPDRDDAGKSGSVTSQLPARAVFRCGDLMAVFLSWHRVFSDEGWGGRDHTRHSGHPWLQWGLYAASHAALQTTAECHKCHIPSSFIHWFSLKLLKCHSFCIYGR